MRSPSSAGFVPLASEEFQISRRMTVVNCSRSMFRTDHNGSIGATSPSGNPLRNIGLCARICKIVHSTRLSERPYFRSVGRPNGRFSTEWPINRGLAVEMTLRGRDDGASATTVLPALGAWKPAKDAGFHIPTATATAAVKWDKLLNPRQSYISTDSRAEPNIVE